MVGFELRFRLLPPLLLLLLPSPLLLSHFTLWIAVHVCGTQVESLAVGVVGVGLVATYSKSILHLRCFALPCPHHQSSCHHVTPSRPSATLLYLPSLDRTLSLPYQVSTMGVLGRVLGFGGQGPSREQHPLPLKHLYFSIFVAFFCNSTNKAQMILVSNNPIWVANLT